MSGGTANIEIFTEPRSTRNNLRKRTTKWIRINNRQLRRDFKKFVSTISASDFEKLPAWRDGDEKPTFFFENQRRSSVASYSDEDSDFKIKNEGVLDILSNDEFWQVFNTMQ